jgi:hypothetical protein
METSCGFIAGFVYCFGMVNRVYPEPPEDEGLGWPSACAILYTLGLIPLWHRLNRIEPATKLAEWTKTFQSYGYANPERLAQTLLWLVDAVCVLGFIGAASWLVIHFRRRERWAAFPVLWLSGTMLLFQNLTAHFLIYPSRPHYINMHYVFWILFVLMLIYVAIARPEPAAAREPSEAREGSRLFAAASLAAAVAVLGLVVWLSGYVNNEKTMATANTRWPIWAWPQGPFPGRGTAR